MFYEVRELNIADDRLCSVGTVIRLAFADVAEEFHLTPRNCRNHPAFLSDADLAEPLHRLGVICFGALKEDVLVGFVAVWPKGPDAFELEPEEQVPQAQSIYELTRLCVLPEHRHMGLGGRLLQFALQAAEGHGARKVAIGIINENERLKAWYEEHGFRVVAVREYRHLPFVVCEMEWEV